MLYMIVEYFHDGDARPVYRRFREKGRMESDGVRYISSWIDERLERCFQLMEADDPRLIDDWTAKWDDIVRFEVHPVLTSAEALARIGPTL
jgi:hypothetical protein